MNIDNRSVLPLALCAWMAVSAGPAGTVRAAAADTAVSAADSIRKYRFLGKASRDKKEYAEAVEYYTELVKYAPQDRPAHYYIGRALLSLGRQDEAKRELLAAAAIDSTHTNTSLSLFQIYTAQGVLDSAWVFLARPLRRKPGELKYLGYRRDLADLYRRQGQVLPAIRHYTALAECESLPAAARQELFELLAVMHADRGDPAAALAWRRRLADVGGPGQVESLSKMVDLQIETKDYDGAYQTLRQLARIDSAGRYAHFHRMSELGDLAADGKVKLQGLEGMARTQPNDVETVAAIAEIHLNSQDLAAAAQWIERGLERAPRDAHLRLLHGDVLAQRGSEDGAIAEYELARKDPNWASVAQQRIWQIRPPETEEEKLRKQFFGGGGGDSEG